MTPPRRRVSQEPYSGRSKTRCLTCKRVKCDETKPSCLRCTSTGRKCDGYESKTPPSFTRASPPLPSLALSTLTNTGSERELRSFQFFYARTVPSLAGYCGSEFWSRLVLQVSQHEKPVWHALVALGALHENFENMPFLSLTRDGGDTFAMREYLSAIRALLGPMEASSFDSGCATGGASGMLTVDVCLISCILFVCYEILSNHYVAALGHIRSGIKILEAVYYDPGTGMYRHPFLRPSTTSTLEIENLRNIFLRLHGQAWALTRADIDNPSMSVIQLNAAFPTQVPLHFSTLAEARDLYEYHTCMMRCEYNNLLGTATESDLYTFGQRCVSLFQAWSNTLDQFENVRGPILTTKDRIGLKILQVHRCEQAMLLEQHLSGVGDSSRWDRYNAMFQEITSLSASVVEMSAIHDSTSASRFKPNFSLDMGIIGPLYNVATLCRDPVIRRRAVGILRGASRQEGVFNSHICAVAAEKVIALEESIAAEGGSESAAAGRRLSITRCSEVPDNARFSYAYPEFDIVRKTVSLRIGQETGVRIDLPLPAMTAMLDAEGV
ncbi:hypothetical protein BO71DRAFT_400360 [Aspergillus ellipticus CBS 707.79]|uniref:Zn(2)-C6 fungal-type domain-containing protein n=1 Tax=Aspergillus ellipticus CBS 707.79 TaxID=1448320 RepID=A0A319D674_9EURO|nr:hypothetical protein BO71DRAFT_400360 [Aspergillus ellipticus CBS 707.79]